MAKELPYFQFEPAEYLTKDISFCSLSAQGLFINLCAYYWQRGCKITKTQFLKRLNNEKEFTELLEEGIFDLDNDGNISVGFLDIQFMSIEEQQKENSTRGKIGNLKRWNIDAYNKFMSKELTLEEALKLPKVSGGDRGATTEVSGDDALAIAKKIADKKREDKIKEDKKREDNRIERLKKAKAEFKNSLLPHLSKYGKKTLNDFYQYWTEHGENDKKMRFEKQTSYSIPHRLSNWVKNDFGKSYKDEAVTAVNKRVSTIKIG
jgi:hypothetical protein